MSWRWGGSVRDYPMDEQTERRILLDCFSLPELRAILRDTLKHAEPSDAEFIKDVAQAIARAERKRL
jgi:hypothetical protein